MSNPCVDVRSPGFILKGTFNRRRSKLKGETALLRYCPIRGSILAQFDNLALGLKLTHGWSQFRSKNWDLNCRSKILKAKKPVAKFVSSSGAYTAWYDDKGIFHERFG